MKCTLHTTNEHQMPFSLRLEKHTPSRDTVGKLTQRVYFTPSFLDTQRMQSYICMRKRTHTHMHCVSKSKTAHTRKKKTKKMRLMEGTESQSPQQIHQMHLLLFNVSTHVHACVFGERTRVTKVTVRAKEN